MTTSLARARPTILWDRNELAHITDGRPSAVLGPLYADLDDLDVRIRVPSPPFQLATDIRRIDGRRGDYEHGFLEWTYRVEPTDWCCDAAGRTGEVGVLETSHCFNLLLCYLGVDTFMKQTFRYRFTDVTYRFHDAYPKAGDLLRGTARIKSYTGLDRVHVFLSAYEVCVDDRRIAQFEITSGCFSPEDIEQSPGYTLTEEEAATQAEVIRVARRAVLPPPLPEGGAVDALAPSLASFQGDDRARVLRRVLHVDPAWRQGLIVGEGFVPGDAWFYPVHCTNDPVFPQVLLLHALRHLLEVYLWLALPHADQAGGWRAESARGEDTIMHARRQIGPRDATLLLYCCVTRLDPRERTARADGYVTHGDRTIFVVKNFGVRLEPHP